MKCAHCHKDFKVILCHLIKSEKCQQLYDIEEIRESNRKIQLEKKGSKYQEKKDEILEKRKLKYQEKKDGILEKRKLYYKKNKIMISNERKTNVGKRFQYKRFKKYFQQKHASAYFTPEQEHLFNHTRGFCQPHTMVELNHCIEYMDGKCIFCVHNTAVKIIGVNKIVCLSCNKAYCLVCTTEVDPDPILGVVHFSPDDGTLLSFIPGRCPLYTGSRVYKDLWGSYA